LGFPSALTVPDEMLFRIDALERIKKQRYVPPFVYFQNIRDEKHYDSQYGAFKNGVKAFSQFDPRVHRFVEYSQWNLTKGGHFPLKESFVLRAIEQILYGDGQFRE